MKRSLLMKLAPYEPLNQDEQGGCVFCGGAQPGIRYGDSGRFLTDHERGCPWVKARRALGDRLPASREALYAFLRDRLPRLTGCESLIAATDKHLLKESITTGLAEPAACAWRLTEEGEAWIRSAKSLIVPIIEIKEGGCVLVDMMGSLAQVSLYEGAVPQQGGLVLIRSRNSEEVFQGVLL